METINPAQNQDLEKKEMGDIQDRERESGYPQVRSGKSLDSVQRPGSEEKKPQTRSPCLTFVNRK